MAMQRRRTGSNPNGATFNNRSRNVYYPSSDGRSMGETDLHQNEMARLISTLEYCYAQRPDVYVSGNLLLYSVEGDPRKVISPDVFVAFGIAKHLCRRRNAPMRKHSGQMTKPSARRLHQSEPTSKPSERRLRRSGPKLKPKPAGRLSSASPS
jgi:hypothetical protein